MALVQLITALLFSILIINLVQQFVTQLIIIVLLTLYVFCRIFAIRLNFLFKMFVSILLVFVMRIFLQILLSLILNLVPIFIIKDQRKHKKVNKIFCFRQNNLFSSICRR